ncbi:MAG: hypothetical protein ACYCQK_01240 [Acidiferrobacteraceae bacterium]
MDAEAFRRKIIKAGAPRTQDEARAMRLLIEAEQEAERHVAWLALVERVAGRLRLIVRAESLGADGQREAVRRELARLDDSRKNDGQPQIHT